MQELLFDTPWWLPAAAIGAGLAMLVSGNRKQDKTLFRTGLAAFLVGVLVALVSYLVDTDVEKVENRTYQLVAAVNAKDWDALKSLLDPKTAFYGYHNRDELVEGAKLTADKIGFKSVRVLGMEAVQHPGIILVSIRVLSDHDGAISGTFPSDWQLEWQDLGHGWSLHTIRNLAEGQLSEAAVKGQLVHPK